MLMVVIIGGCVHEPLVPESVDPNNGNPIPGETCDPDVAYYNKVQDILLTNCAMSGCHDQATAEDDVILNSYENVMGSRVIESGDPNDSELYERITDNDPDDMMPPPGDGRQPLTTDQVALIAQWISEGAKNITCNAIECVTDNVSYTTNIQPLLDQKCVNCHRGTSPSGGVNLSSYEGVSVVAVNGKLLGAVSHTPPYTPMPYGGQKLEGCQIEMIKQWIEGGSGNN